MEKNYTAPNVDKTSFHCPHCGTKAPQLWLDCYGEEVPTDDGLPYVITLKKTEKMIEDFKSSDNGGIIFEEDDLKHLREKAINAEGEDFCFRSLDSKNSRRCNYSFENIFFSVCQELSCKKAALWVHDRLIIPASCVEEPPNDDMPDKIKVIYNEAREIHNCSPRASAALLRLCCEMLCDDLDAKGQTLNGKIGDLVYRGMDNRVQKALDVVRFVGNDSVHPGQIDLSDNLDVSHTLFVLVNEIVQEMISKPKRLNKIYEEKLPQSVKEGIEKRDKKKA
ncbi:MAG: DUF4145 domain-containing protein [Rickettsiales bacterium]|nr:DUF4145 domain-containing protein [Pseudomonadota bacterium]MDA0965445.1 DUF4145 domain-containing protein [Pseudomonadota bacterium]MDG4542770.1 DUF4145 domain-containing protein [Rickettsiales bacterium]MDG4544782.1 DUF4145 domain-containing protein [Rickettsiales bacterium]MDG4546904.1 DUF4145 domain-containing protein [Rickettsiales bacterium]